MFLKKFDPFKKKMTVYLYDKNWYKLNGILRYDRNDKRFYIIFGKEKLPVTDEILNSIICDTLFIVRKGLNDYVILEPHLVEFVKQTVEKDGKMTEVIVPVFDKVTNPELISFTTKEIDPATIYGALLDAELRKERQKSNFERLLPILMMCIALVAVGIFIAIVWGQTSSSLERIAVNLNEMAGKLENATLILKHGQTLPSR